jgi:hypothetical protein
MPLESPPADDAAAERAIMGASAVTIKFDCLATAATAILAQVCPAETVAATRVKGAMISMLSRGALEREGVGVAVRFERLAYVNRARIRARQWQLGLERGWPPNVATLERETQPSLPLAAFMPNTQDTLHHFLEEGLISSCTRAGEPMIAESDFLSCHPACLEGPFRPLAAFSDNPTFVGVLLADHAASPMLVVRNGIVCVPWAAINDYTPLGATPLSWELEPDEIFPFCGPT